jgi:hypothetical protein
MLASGRTAWQFGDPSATATVGKHCVGPTCLSAVSLSTVTRGTPRLLGWVCFWTQWRNGLTIKLRAEDVGLLGRRKIDAYTDQLTKIIHCVVEPRWREPDLIEPVSNFMNITRGFL